MLKQNLMAALLGTAAVFAGPKIDNTLTGGVVIEADPCLPNGPVDVMTDERGVTAVDAANGSVIYRYEGEWPRKTAACGNTALALTDKHLLFYSQDTGRWLVQAVVQSDQVIGVTRGYNFSLGRDMAVFATLNEAWFFRGTKKVIYVSFSGDRLRGTAAFGDAGCIVTDRRTYCVGNKSDTARTYELSDMHIRQVRALSGKIIMRAPEKTLIYFPERDQYEFTPQR
ncbi:MAG: hypothetical protein OHK0011_12910 [Turneriella sp.]